MSFEFPFEYADIPGFGRLFYPIVRIDLYTVEGWQQFEFLIDTGADITTVPAHLLPVLGIEKKALKPSRTLGVGGFSVETFEFRLRMRLGKKDHTIAASAVESQTDAMPLLLGRKDVFEELYNLYLDSKRKVTVIIENATP